MATLISPGILTLSTSLPYPSSTYYRIPSFAQNSLRISARSMSTARVSGDSNGGQLLEASAFSTGSAVVSDDIIDVLGEVGIFTARGEPVQFKDLWDQEKGIAVVALLRHFGCVCSWELAMTLRESMGKFDSAGVKLIAVGVGTPDKAQILAERLPFPLDSLYADPDRKAYEVLGLYYGFRRTFLHPATKIFSRGEPLKKATKNYTIKATPNASSVLQQGGMFVFKGKELLYARKDEGTGDHAPLDDIFNICCKVPVA